MGIWPWPGLLGLGLAGAGVAIVGFLDDKGNITPKWRLLVHFTAATIVVYTVGGLPALSMFGYPLSLGWMGNLLAVIAIVWILNLYNFMDGIDGIAGTEALSALGIMACLLIPMNTGLCAMHSLLAAAVCGFLFWNFPPAKIFMGDAGSGFLGLMLAALLLFSASTSPALFWSWLIMLGVFIVDATFTLTRILLRGEKVYEAHSTHAYQHATRKYGRHLPITLSVLTINLLWLSPIAFFVARGTLDGATGLCIAYAPLLVLAYRFKAGNIDL